MIFIGQKGFNLKAYQIFVCIFGEISLYFHCQEQETYKKLLKIVEKNVFEIVFKI